MTGSQCEMKVNSKEQKIAPRGDTVSFVSRSVKSIVSESDIHRLYLK